jgi:hypothetical protein
MSDLGDVVEQLSHSVLRLAKQVMELSKIVETQQAQLTALTVLVQSAAATKQ